MANAILINPETLKALKDFFYGHLSWSPFYELCGILYRYSIASDKMSFSYKLILPDATCRIDQPTNPARFPIILHSTFPSKQCCLKTIK